MKQPRYLESYLKKDLLEKILILSGPRQVGKTTLSKMLSSRHDYFNYYAAEDRLRVDKQNWNLDKDYIVLDELHIKKEWKKWLKGLYETKGIPPGIVVTGSARLEAYRKRTGDSLAGCYFPFRLHPLDLKEIFAFSKKKQKEDTILDRLLKFGGFPEPYFKGQTVFYNRWQRTHIEALLREDILEIESLQSVSDLRLLIELLRQSIGSPVNYCSLGNTIARDGKTVKRWLTILENFYVIFKVKPYHNNVKKTLIKRPKYYFYDTGFVEGKGAKLENLVACSLVKNKHFYEDCYGETRDLFYLRDKEGREIDFLITKDKNPSTMIETKWKDENLSPHFFIFSQYFPKNVTKIQLVKELNRERTIEKQYEVKKASLWLRSMSL